MFKSKPIKYTLWGLAVLVLLITMFNVGLHRGENNQLRLRTLQNISDAAKTATALEGFRRGHDEASINLLESQLDLFIINHALLLKTGGKPFAKNKASLSLMESVAKYRSEYPSRATGDNLKLIEETLDIYRNK